MAKLMDIVVPVLLLGGVVVAYTQRCDLFKLCGDDGDDEAFAEDDYVEDESTTSSGGNDATAASTGCCKCRKESNGDVRCQRHGKGNWTRYKSAPQDIGKALSICRNGCSGGGSSSSGGSSSKAVRCPTGYNSVNGKCQKIQTAKAGSGKATNQNAATAKPKPKVTSASQLGQNCPKGQVRSKINNRCYKPITPSSSYTHQMRSYFADPAQIQPFNLYHRIGNMR